MAARGWGMGPKLGELRGVVRGKTIELEQEPGLPDGQAVAVILHQRSPRGGGLRRAFGSWADDADGLRDFVDQVRQDRQHDRREPIA